jgi:hypothetical protein
VTHSRRQMSALARTAVLAYATSLDGHKFDPCEYLALKCACRTKRYGCQVLIAAAQATQSIVVVKSSACGYREKA